MLTHKRLLEVLNYDPNSGVFTWRVRIGQSVVGTTAGSIHNRYHYLYIQIDCERYRAHRLAWFYVYKVWPSEDIDHLDGNTLNNAINNLRAVSRLINMQNQRRAHRTKKSTSKFLGVSWNQERQKWVAQIKVRGTTCFLGRFKSESAAYRAYLIAKRREHEGCTV
jgi:hypothetical protein